MPLTQKMTAAAPARTLNALLRDISLQQALGTVEQHIRSHPEAAAHRMLRFDLLCLLGDWERALRQLQTCATLNPALTPLAYVYRDMIRGEQFRAEVFRGERRPATPESTPPWLLRQLDALECQARPDHAGADAVRREALRDLPDTPGLAELVPSAPLSDDGRPPSEARPPLSEHPADEDIEAPQRERRTFQWISDSDSRLGPVLEAYVQGQYRWIPFADLAEIRLPGPAAPRDLIWLPVQLRLGREDVSGFLPARYPGSESAGDAFRLGRETRWEDVGETGVFGLGQKVWTTDQGDLPVYDVRRVVFASAVVQDDPDAVPATHGAKTRHAA